MDGGPEGDGGDIRPGAPLLEESRVGPAAIARDADEDLIGRADKTLPLAEGRGHTADHPAAGMHRVHAGRAIAWRHMAGDDGAQKIGDGALMRRALEARIGRQRQRDA
jgi:hypothetical protein